MQTFSEHYYISEKITSDIRRALTSNLLKKRKVRIDLGKGKYKIVVPATQSSFNRIKESIRRDVVDFFKSSRKPKTKRKTNIKKAKPRGTYVKNVYEGEVDSGVDILDGMPIASIVYELSNGSRIAFVTTEDDQGIVRRYISTNSKGNDFLRTNLGTTVQQISADAAESKKIGTRSRPESPSEEFRKISKSIEKIEEEPPEEEEEEYKEIGILDISKNEYDNLVKVWGDGKTGGAVKGATYQFRNLFTRSRYFSPEGYKGYKYSDKDGNTVYLVDTGDGENAFIAFDGKESYNWAENIGLLSFWRTKPDKTSIFWRPGTIEDL